MQYSCADGRMQSITTPMNVAIMQPYFFPYIGYYQLFAATDCFVILDDVNFIKKGWIHRNRILRGEQECMFTLAINGASQYKLINELTIFESESTKRAILNSITVSYQNAPFYEARRALLEDIILFPEENLSHYLSYGLRRLAKYLNLNPRFIMSSDIPKDASLAGQDRIVEICKILGAARYINPIGGITLYEESAFRMSAIDLLFIKAQSKPYRQFGSAFIPHLSIIDALMFNRLDQIQEELMRFKLITTSQAKQ